MRQYNYADEDLSSDQFEAVLRAVFGNRIESEREPARRTIADDVVTIFVWVIFGLMILNFWRAVAPPLRFEIFGYSIQIPHEREQRQHLDPRLGAPHLT